MVRYIKKGESSSAEPNTLCIFKIGSAISTNGQLRMFVKETRLIQAESGMTEEDGSPVDIRKYTIRISKKAFKECLNHVEFEEQ